MMVARASLGPVSAFVFGAGCSISHCAEEKKWWTQPAVLIVSAAATATIGYSAYMASQPRHPDGTVPGQRKWTSASANPELQEESKLKKSQEMPTRRAADTASATPMPTKTLPTTVEPVSTPTVSESVESQHDTTSDNNWAWMVAAAGGAAVIGLSAFALQKGKNNRAYAGRPLPAELTSSRGAGSKSETSAAPRPPRPPIPAQAAPPPPPAPSIPTTAAPKVEVRTLKRETTTVSVKETPTSIPVKGDTTVIPVAETTTSIPMVDGIITKIPMPEPSNTKTSAEEALATEEPNEGGRVDEATNQAAVAEGLAQAATAEAKAAGAAEVDTVEPPTAEAAVAEEEAVQAAAREAAAAKAAAVEAAVAEAAAAVSAERAEAARIAAADQAAADARAAKEAAVQAAAEEAERDIMRHLVTDRLNSEQAPASKNALRKQLEAHLARPLSKVEDAAAREVFAQLRPASDVPTKKKQNKKKANKKNKR